MQTLHTECKLLHSKYTQIGRSQFEAKCRHDLRKNHRSERKTISVCDNKRVKYNLLCIYVDAYPTPKEKTGVLTHWQE